MSKYDKLWIYIKNNKSKKLTFDQVNNILGFNLDHSFLTYKKELEKYNYKIKKTSLKDKIIFIEKIGE